MPALVLVLLASLVPAGQATADEIVTAVNLTASATQTFRNDFVTLRATVTPNPGGGEVRFVDTTSDRCLCAFSINPATGEAAGEVRMQELGTRQLQAEFMGFGGYAASASDLLAHEVVQRPSTVTLEIGPIDEVGDLTLTTTVTPGNVGGTVSIHAASGEAVVSEVGVQGPDGLQHFTVHAPMPGTGPYTASFSGTFEYAPAESAPVAWSDERTPTTTTLTATPTSGAPYDPIDFDVKVDPDAWDGAGPMNGIVRFYADGATAPWAEVEVSGNGVARTTRSFGTPGTPVVHALYSGDEDYVGSRSADVAITLERIEVTTTLELDTTVIEVGESVTVTVTVDPPPAVWPADPAATLRISARTGTWFTRSVPIDPSTGVGQTVIDAASLEPEVWTIVAAFAANPPVSNRYVPSESDPVQLRYEPVGPSHALSIGPAPLYVGDMATITAVLDPAPAGGSLELWGTSGTVGEEPFLLGSTAAAATVEFPTPAVDGRRFFTRFTGFGDVAVSRSAELVPSLLHLPTTSISGPSAWTFAPTTPFEFSAGTGSVTPVTFECSLDGGSWFACTSPYITPPLADGPHTFRVRATDANGRVQLTPSQTAWRIDTSAPLITSAVANGGQPTNETLVSVQLGVTDQVLGRHGGGWHRLTSSSADLDSDGRLINPGGPLFLTDPNAPFSWNLAPSGTSPVDGLHTLYIQVADPFGHWSDVVSVSVRLDRAPPTVRVSLNEDEAATVNPRVAVGLCCLGADPSGIAEIRVSSAPDVAEGLLVHSKAVSVASSFDWSLTDPATGGRSILPGSIETRHVYVQWRDRAGNWSAVASDGIRVHGVSDGASHPYLDVGGSKFESDIAYLFRQGWTSGCAVDRFCPDGLVTRGQMAAFLSRALDLPATGRDFFSDDAASKFQGDINRLAAAGITSGCGESRYCPDGLITRGQMAAFLHRALR